MEILLCPRCQGEMASGDLMSQAGVNFQPHERPWFTLTTNHVGIEAFMCLSCGHIELRGDVEKLREVTKRGTE